MFKWLGCLICSCYAISLSHAQFFTEVQDNLSICHNYSGNYYGGGVSFYDFNKDGWDDLTLSSGNGNYKFYLNSEGTFEEISLVEGLNEVKSLIWVDYDNDGDADLSVTELYGAIRIFRNNGSLEFSELIIDNSDNIEAYNSGISWADFDNDGLLDFYVCRYPELFDGEFQPTSNLLFKQTTGGSFINVTEELGLGNGIQESFIATWADFDNDLDVDLYIANDRLSFPNALYLNEGEGTFTDYSQESAADISIFAMSSTVGDYDNDGDLDIYCSNGHAGNHLLMNTGDATFEDQFPLSGAEAFAFSWGCTWVDYDNNGWKDLYVCTDMNNEDAKNRLFLNNEDGTFSAADSYTSENEAASHSVAKGDFNNDGKYDLLVLNEAPYFSKLMMNTESSVNNYVKLKLEGTLSNRDAIGSKITYWTEGLPKTEFTTCGSDYLSQDSQSKILGFGNSPQIDSLKVRWPSGLVDWHYNILADSTLCLLENSTFNTSVISSSNQIICNNQDLTLSIDGGYQDVTWSNDDTGSETSIVTPGSYWATVTLSEFFSFNTDTIEIEEGNDINIVDVYTLEPLCFGAENGFLNITYTSEEEFTPLYFEESNLTAGNYFYTLELENHCSSNINITIDEPSELAVIPITVDATCQNFSDGELSVITFGGVPEYDLSIFPTYPLDSLPPGSYTLFCQDANGCQTEEPFEINYSIALEYELLIQGEDDFSLGSLEVISLGDTQISTFVVYDLNDEEQIPTSLNSGEYSVLIFDEYGCDYFIDFEVPLTTSVLENNANNEINLYPNPTLGKLYIESQSRIKAIQILSTHGQLILDNDFTIEQKFLDLELLPKGVYVIKIITDTQFKTELIFLE